jgi:hypothetical protein
MQARIESMFCPRCNAEYRVGFTRCDECGVPLIYRLPIERHHSLESEAELVVVGTYNNKLDADLAKMALEAAGIDSMFRTDGVSQIYSFPFFREIALIVRSDDADDAKKILSLNLHEKEF